MKRLFDIVLALFLFPPALVIILFASIPVLIESRANPLFLQIRVGRHQALFRILKLRTMHPDTAHVASHKISANQIMRSGFLLRKTKIDELPQIWNVLIGQMSFVGPRPCLPSQLELRNAREARGVYCLRPGITGCAQIRGIDMSTPNELAIADASYLDKWSMMKDIQIILATAFGSGQGDAVATNKPS
jgi:O-antigen biosynthesis protein WbqP